MGIPRGTTPTLTLTFTEESLDLTQAENVYVTFTTEHATLTKTGEDLEVAAKQIDVYLSQQETLSFPAGQIQIQANWTYAGGDRGASDVALFEFTPQLLNSVLS